MNTFHREKTNLIFLNVCFALLLALIIVLNCVAVYWSGALESYFGFIGASGIGPYESDYTDEELLQAEIDLATDIMEDGTVLLENENNALPLSANDRVTLFGIVSYSWVGTSSYGSAGSASTNVSLKEALEGQGFAVNDTVWNYYEDSGVRYVGTSYDLVEIGWDQVNGATASSFSSYNDAAILVFGRVGGEGEDLPTSTEQYGGSSSEDMAQLSSTELGLIRGAVQAGFEKVIVIFNTAFAMEVNWQELGVDAALVCPGTGNYGIYGIANVLSGTNPSGHLVDTYVYDNFSSPAVQNMSVTRYTQNGSTVIDSYVHYAEGIYVGYKYYETRYEDAVMGTDGVGDYDYAETVAYAFGYGLSYTTFAYSDFSVERDDDRLIVRVTVENTGSVPGKDAVGIYFQAPFTEYDRENGIEKASVNLVKFGKTGEIAPGGSEEIAVAFSIADMKSWDSAQTQGYILEQGDYYITAAPDAHAAVNNILAQKGYTNLVGEGDTDLVDTYTQDALETFTEDDATGTALTNRFAFAESDGIYLSRTDWSVMDSWDPDTLLGGLSYNTGTTVIDGVLTGTHEMSADLASKLARTGWERSERPADARDDSEPLFEQPTGLLMADAVGAAYDDDIWLQLASTCTFAELHGMFNRAGYNTRTLESINKPATSDVDGPPGLASFIASWTGFSFPSETSVAQTWNRDYAEQMGELVAEDALRLGVSGWYAPGINIHRTPFSARNAEYYSEDPVMSGLFAVSLVNGAQGNGLYCYGKHLALNEHETNRNTYCSWAQEQAIREVYLKPFEMAVKDADMHGIMTSMNKIGYIDTENSYALVTTVLRDEWGFEGAVITDYTSEADAEACLAAGVDLILSTTAIRLQDTSPNYIRNEIKQAAKHTLYMVAQSNAMNIFLDGNTDYSAGIPTYVVILIVLDCAVGVGVIVGEIFAVRLYLKRKKQERQGL